MICCYNAAELLPETLAALAAQQVPAGTDWEVIVIDNACTDGTAEVARRCWSGPVGLSVVSESRPGASYARQRGMANARYSVVGFVDADNRLAPDWVGEALAVFRARPEVGACGGFSELEPGGPVPDWFSAYHSAYAVGPQAGEAGDVTDKRGYLWGAGLCVRRAAWQQLMQSGFEPSVPDRRGRSLSAGGDSELCFGLRLIGWRLWYAPGMVLRHYIPASRMRRDHLLAMCRGFGSSAILRRAYSGILKGETGRPPSWSGEMMAAARELLLSAGTRLLPVTSGDLPLQRAVRMHKALGRCGALLGWSFRFHRLHEQPRRLAGAGSAPVPGVRHDAA